MTHDVTERVEAERRLAQKEEQLREAQKLEPVGLLAGGIVHHYNNMLASILGYTEFLLSDPTLGDADARKSLQTIGSEARRAADLTQELLTLSQKQYVRPAVLEFNEAVRDSVSALRSVLGEAVELVLSLDPATGQVAIDPHQLEELLTYLPRRATKLRPGSPRMPLTVRTDAHRVNIPTVQLQTG